MNDQSTTKQDQPRFSVPLPQRMRSLPRDERGYVVPYFVQFFKDGKPVSWDVSGAKPDFRVVNPQSMYNCLAHERCWVCGTKLETNRVHMIGPMCAINRITSEPPMHYACAVYAAQVCPMMLQPRMKRDLDYSDIKGGVVPPSGMHDLGNPGVFVSWMQRTPPKLRQMENGVLLELGDPTTVEWWTRGRKATYAEADAALVLGHIKLENIARTKDGPGAIEDLHKLYMAARKYLPS